MHLLLHELRGLLSQYHMCTTMINTWTLICACELYESSDALVEWPWETVIFLNRRHQVRRPTISHNESSVVFILIESGVS
jgi:hypothetical protein